MYLWNFDSFSWNFCRSPPYFSWRESEWTDSRALTGFAAGGVMVAASIWSLLIPAVWTVFRTGEVFICTCHRQQWDFTDEVLFACWIHDHIFLGLLMTEGPSRLQRELPCYGSYNTLLPGGRNGSRGCICRLFDESRPNYIMFLVVSVKEWKKAVLQNRNGIRI